MTETRTHRQQVEDRVIAVGQFVVFVGMPLFLVGALLDAPHPIEFHWPSAATGAMFVLLVDVAAVFSWMTWSGRTRQASDQKERP